MKKALVLSIVLVAAVFTLGSVNKVYASSGNPSTTAASDNYGFGGQGGMMGGTQQGLLHDEMVIVVAEKLGISVRTVEGHFNNIFIKLGVSSRIEAVLCAVSRRLVVLDEEARS